MSIAPLIELKNVSRAYKKNGARAVGVSNVSFSVQEGEIIALVGPSGCGKTTILRMIADIISPDTGSVVYENRSINHARITGLIGYVPQSPSLIPFRSVVGNIRLPLEIKGTPDASRVEELVSLCALEGFENYFPSELSGGMKQRTAIACALACHPRVLLMDEPFAALDEMIKEKLNEEVLRIQSALKTTIVYVTHNIEEAVFLANRVVVLSPEPGSVVGIIPIDLPLVRDARLRTDPRFFQETIKVRNMLKSI
ncbi:MAG: ABC transporter ATP-binding protein [Patescibacteria group bacterium]